MSEAIGLGTSTATCVPGIGGLVRPAAFHTWYGFSTTAPVRYEPEGMQRGVGTDRHVEAQVEGPWVTHWYLSTKALDGVAAANLVAADVVLQVAVREGGGFAEDDAAYDAGDLLAEGHTSPAVLAGPLSSGPVTHSRVGDEDVYHFAVALDPLVHSVPDTGLNIKVVVHMDVPCPDGHVMPNTVRLHSSHMHRPRLVLGVTNPLRIETLQPQFVSDVAILGMNVTSPWGPYDVDSASWTLEHEGPAKHGPYVLVVTPDYHHLTGPQPLSAAAVWSGLGPGEYRLSVGATNLQGKGSASATWTFTVAEQEAPGIGVAAILLLVGLAVRRR